MTVLPSTAPIITQRIRNPVVKDQPGELNWLKVAELQIDRRYQRNVSQKKVVEMARRWSWIACGAITVALRGDCSWWVIDGQHRVAAAQMRGDIDLIPCIMFEMDDTPAEAQAFVDTNTNRKMPTVVNKFNALLHAGDRIAEDVQEMISRTGHRVGDPNSGPLYVSCAAALMNGMQENGSAMRIVWPVVAELCRGKRVTQNIVQGMMHLERKLKADQSFSDKRWRDRILQVGYEKINESISRAGAFRQSHGPVSSAIGIAEAINHGLRVKLVHSIQLGDDK
jgi:hypothetical protein